MNDRFVLWGKKDSSIHHKSDKDGCQMNLRLCFENPPTTEGWRELYMAIEHDTTKFDKSRLLFSSHLGQSTVYMV